MDDLSVEYDTSFSLVQIFPVAHQSLKNIVYVRVLLLIDIVDLKHLHKDSDQKIL